MKYLQIETFILYLMSEVEFYIHHFGAFLASGGSRKGGTKVREQVLGYRVLHAV